MPKSSREKIEKEFKKWLSLFYITLKKKKKGWTERPTGKEHNLTSLDVAVDKAFNSTGLGKETWHISKNQSAL